MEANNNAETKRLAEMWKRRKTSVDFEVFIKHLNNLEQRCTYCGITELQIQDLVQAGRLSTKRLSTRGRRLELDRKNSEEPYDNLDNIVLACYWCNNAKTDTFSHEEFLKIGKAIQLVWSERLNNNN